MFLWGLLWPGHLWRGQFHLSGRVPNEVQGPQVASVLYPSPLSNSLFLQVTWPASPSLIVDGPFFFFFFFLTFFLIFILLTSLWIRGEQRKCAFRLPS